MLADTFHPVNLSYFARIEVGQMCEADRQTNGKTLAALTEASFRINSIYLIYSE